VHTEDGARRVELTRRRSDSGANPTRLKSTLVSRTNTVDTTFDLASRQSAMAGNRALQAPEVSLVFPHHILGLQRFENTILRFSWGGTLGSSHILRSASTVTR